MLRLLVQGAVGRSKDDDMSRSATIELKTKETEIAVALNTDGVRDVCIETGRVFDHMLVHLCVSRRLGLTLTARGDLK